MTDKGHLSLTITDAYEVRGRMVYGIAAPFEMDRDKPEIIGRRVRLFVNNELKADGIVDAVERFMPRHPIAKGEPLGLMLATSHLRDFSHEVPPEGSQPRVGGWPPIVGQEGDDR